MTTSTVDKPASFDRPGDYSSDEDHRPSNVAHSDDRPVSPIAAAAWDRRIANGELLVVDAEPRSTSVDGGEVKKIRNFP